MTYWTHTVNINLKPLRRYSPHPINKSRPLPNTQNLQSPPSSLLTQRHPYSWVAINIAEYSLLFHLRFISTLACAVSQILEPIDGTMVLAYDQYDKWDIWFLYRDARPSLEVYYYFDGTLSDTIATRFEYPPGDPFTGLAEDGPKDTLP